MIINAPNGYYVLATDAAQLGEPPGTHGLGLHPRNDCIIATTIHAGDDERASIEVNLAIANMDFVDFSDNVAADGVFRGFPTG